MLKKLLTLGTLGILSLSTGCMDAAPSQTVYTQTTYYRPAPAVYAPPPRVYYRRSYGPPTVVYTHTYTTYSTPYAYTDY